MMEGKRAFTMNRGTSHSHAVPAHPTARSTRSEPAGLRPSENARELRERLLEAAIEVIADGGYPRLRESADPLILA